VEEQSEQRAMETMSQIIGSTTAYSTENLQTVAELEQIFEGAK
jgi:hypothetical protein